MFLIKIQKNVVFLLIFIFVQESRSLTKTIWINNITLIGSEKNMANIFEINPGSSVRLACRFCSQRQNYQQVSWSYRKRGNNETLSVITKGYRTTYNYDLLLNNFTVDDSGVFSCKTSNLDDDAIATFVLEAVEIDVDDKVGTFEQWANYKISILDPINRILSDLKIELCTEFSFRLFTAWDNYWGPCELSSSNRTKRRKRGRCRLHPILHQTDKKKVHNKKYYSKSIQEIFINDNFDVSCYSLNLRIYLPRISDVVRYIPEFVATESCTIIPENKGTNIVDRIEPNYSNKSMTKQVVERANVVLRCPKAALPSKVEWFKDDNFMNSTSYSTICLSSKEPRVIIDTDSLYISHASKQEEGLYSCRVDGKKIQTFNLKVLPQSMLLNDDFLRYSIYLGFILSLTITCYCTGVCVAWHRKTSFADPLNLNNNY